MRPQIELRRIRNQHIINAVSNYVFGYVFNNSVRVCSNTTIETFNDHFTCCDEVHEEENFGMLPCNKCEMFRHINTIQTFYREY